jgi:hypothetical protein
LLHEGPGIAKTLELMKQVQILTCHNKSNKSAS